METILKFKWRKWCYILTIIVLIISSFSLTSLTIYTFTKDRLTAKPVASNLLPPPIFNQSEINQLTTPHGIKIDRFKELIAQKTPAEINHYYTNNQNSSWLLSVVYSWANQSGTWIYELKYD